MLDTKGDTAVYLMFAYARVASILRKVMMMMMMMMMMILMMMAIYYQQ